MTSKESIKNAPHSSSEPFQIQSMDPAQYRRESRKASLIIVIAFAALAMLMSSLLVLWFGSNEGSNFKLNLAGVVLGILLTAILNQSHFRFQPWMQASLYGWRLKRCLMSITNIMHHVELGVTAEDPIAIKTLRFYHLGLLQMHKLDGNPEQDHKVISQLNQLQEKMQELQIDLQQDSLHPEWTLYIRKQYPA